MYMFVWKRTIGPGSRTNWKKVSKLFYAATHKAPICRGGRLHHILYILIVYTQSRIDAETMSERDCERERENALSVRGASGVK